MKKLISLILTVIMLLTLPVAYASDIGVIVNDTKLCLDVPPMVENGRTLVPLRAIFEALGANVNWDNTTSTATSQKDGVTISLTLGKDVMYVNGEEKHLDAPAKAVNGRTLVPVRAISEAFGCDVAWNQALGMVHISDEVEFGDLGTWDYVSSPYSVINNNVPYFNIENYIEI